MFQPVNSKVDFPKMEREIIAWWEEKDIVRKYLMRNEESEKRYSFIDGPITANNPMGVHHAWGRTYKDLFLRYRTMQGYKQRYQNGFDGQGLWIEVEVEKELGFHSKRDIEAFGIDKFVELCKERVLKFSDTITQQSIRLGYWMDWDNSYHTMSDENNYTIWHFLKVCHKRGWIYQGRDVMPWCPRCGTGLSEHEIVTEGYREIVHPGLYVRFPIFEQEEPSTGTQHPPKSLLVWTTTPWTLTANSAAAVHPDQTYVKVSQDGELLYVMKSRLSVLHGNYEILEELQGRDLVGFRYRSPFDELPIQTGVDHRVVGWDEVSETEGTGIVHIAPGAGKEDFALGKQHNLVTIAPLDELGNFVDGFDQFTGTNVYDVNEAIYLRLREKGILYHLEDFSHRYPVCWRCQSELVFRLVDEWFISMDELRDLISEAAKQVHWIPEFGLQRELDWLRNMDDWMISKKRYWGLALPIYKCHCGYFDVIGSEHELKNRAVEGWEVFRGHSPHRPWIDEVKILCPDCGDKISRIGDVGNPWLDAGIVSFSTLNYRHNRDHWSEWFPADWISESFPGQFRNWFYSLLTMSAALEDSAPCRTIFSYALMRDAKGDEMHKSRGNAIWFEDGAERMGVDAMRWVYARQNPASNLSFGYSSADEVRRRFIIPLWNVYSFLVTYANIDEYDPGARADDIEKTSDIDRWIISELNILFASVTDALNKFEPDRATHEIEAFVGYLSNWYVRRSRRRFWKAGLLSEVENAPDEDKLSAYGTLYECLVGLAKLLAPFMPFMTESMYQNLVCSVGGGRESVHLESYPRADESKIDLRLSESTRLAMRLSSLGRSARSKASIKVRQPLEMAMVKLNSSEESLLLDAVVLQVRDELNVKALILFSDECQVTEFEVRPNVTVLGPKYGKELPVITNKLSASDVSQIRARVSRGENIEVGAYILEPGEIIVTGQDRQGYSVASDLGYTVAVTTDINCDLVLEGLARELVHRIQNMRRNAGLEISDYIITYYEGNSVIDQVMTVHSDYICSETLSHRVVNGASEQDAYAETHSIDGLEVRIGVKRA